MQFRLSYLHCVRRPTVQLSIRMNIKQKGSKGLGVRKCSVRHVASTAAACRPEPALLLVEEVRVRNGFFDSFLRYNSAKRLIRSFSLEEPARCSF